jgi:HAT1-interacting factor 1
LIFSGTVSSGKDQEEEDEDSDVEDLAEADEDESDLDLAWKMLDVARAIVEKHSVDTMEKVDILSALAEVALERGLSCVILFSFVFFIFLFFLC